MRIVADTNLLLRLVIRDDDAQRSAAMNVFEEAEAVVNGVHVLCELAWVPSGRYGVAHAAIAVTIRMFTNRHNVVTNLPAAEAGLKILEAGEGFADGAIACKGRWLGCSDFVSFDKEAVRLLAAQGQAAKLVG